MHLTDRQMDGLLIARPQLHSCSAAKTKLKTMQRPYKQNANNCSLLYTPRTYIHQMTAKKYPK